MNLKIKLGMTLVTMSLAACGGESSAVPEEPKPEPAVVNQSYYSFNFDYTNYRSLTYVNNAPKHSSVTELGYGDYLLTENKLYNNIKMQADTRAINELTLNFVDAPNMSRTEYLKKVDLSGVSIFDGVYPGFQNFFKAMNGTPIYANEKIASLYAFVGVEDKFPAGSFCYHEVKRVENKPYILFSSSGYKDLPYSYMPQLLQNWKKAAKADGYSTRVTTGKLNNYPWTKFQVLDQYGEIDRIVVVGYQDMIYQASIMVDAGTFEQSSDAQSILNRAKSYDPNSQDYHHYMAISTYINNNCRYYNDTAIAAIQNYSPIQ